MDNLKILFEQLKAVADALPSLVAYVDREHRYRLANAAYQRWFGIDPTEVIGARMIDILGPAAYQTLKPHLDAGLGGTQVKAETFCDYRFGGGRYIELSVVPDRTDEGETRGAVLLVNDISSRQMAERERLFEAERKANRQLYDLFMTAPAAITILKGPHHIVEFVNQTAMAFFSFPPDCVGRPVAEFRTSLHSRANIELLDRLYREGAPLTLREMPVSDSGMHVQFIDGNIQPTHDPDGQVNGLIIYSFDVTNQVIARQSLKNQHRWLETILDSLPTPVVLFDKTTAEPLFVNKAAALSPIDITASDNSESFYTDPSGRRLSHEEWPQHRATRGETTSGLELIWHGPAAPNPIPLLVDATTLEGLYGHPETTMMVFQEISELKQKEFELRLAKERAEDANRAKSDFLANMSHEIRTPLSAVLGFTELMKDTTLPSSERLNYAEIVNRNGRQLSTLINDILDLSKVEAGKLDIESIPMSLSGVISEVASLLRPEAERKGIRLVVRTMGTDVPDRICSDPTRVHQILTNLIGNAIKFTHNGAVTVSVESFPTDDGDRLIGFRVRDTGIGIPPEKQDRLFRPFSQADTSMTRKYGGTGLGLMLSMRLADLLGGGLTLVDSRVNHGSTFLATVRANLAALSESEEGKSSSPEKGRHEGTVDERFLAGIRILVAEDSPDNQTLIEHYLSGEGAIVEVANNGAEAFEKAVHGDFHVVLMDIQMPVVDGYNATQRLRRTGFDRPIIALTAHALKEERDRSLREGCNDHLTKPVNRRLLISTIGKYIYGERLTSTT